MESFGFTPEQSGNGSPAVSCMMKSLTETNPKIDPAPNSNTEKDPDKWVSGDEPMTGALGVLPQDAVRGTPANLMHLRQR